MRFARMVAVVAAAMACFAPHPAAAAPVALVEDVTGNPPDVGFMDYVDAGKVIQLGARDAMVLSYIQSCVRETIKGGTVTIGVEQSEVQGGQVQRAKVQCDASKMMQTPPQNMAQAAGVVFRSLGPKAGAGGTAPKAEGKPELQPQFVLYGLSPVLQVNGSGQVVIERTDGKGDPIKLSVTEAQLMKGAFFDTATKGVSLAAGGIYKVTWGGRQAVFKVDPAAKPGKSPIIGRLVRLVPAT